MMKSKILVICAVFIAVVSLLLFIRYGSEPQISTTPAADAASGDDRRNSKTPSDYTPRAQNGDSPTAASSGIPSGISPTEASNAYYRELMAEWQATIDFFGKVVDGNSNAIASATIGFQWDETPFDGGSRTATAESDSEGHFSLRGALGRCLEVSVSKTGYHPPKPGFQSFTYAVGGHFVSDPLNPVIFQLHRSGRTEPLIHIAGIGLRTMRDYPLAVDGKPTEISLRDGKISPDGQGDLRVQFEVGPPIGKSARKSSWHCSVLVPGGGLLQTSEEFPFLAPDAGYLEMDQWNVTNTNWTEQVNKQYFVKLRDGSFGRVKLRVIGTKKPFFRLESFVNPSGSRNLEFDPDKLIRPSD